jgi:DNA primase
VTTSNAGNRQLSVGGAWRLRAEINTAIMTSQVRPPVNGETSDFAANVEIYEALLADNPMGGDAAVYLKSRGFSDATVSCFRLGFLRDARTTVQLLVNRFGNEAVYHAGLLSHRDKNATFILPSPSVLFPFIDSGRVVYIQSRILPSGDGKRWMGPRGVAKPVYNVGAISRSKAIYLCEGATDVLSAHELNLAAIGVLGGTSRLPNSVMGALRTHMVYIVPDCDDVGGRMATKMTDSLRGFGVQSVIKSLPMGKDINEYLLMSRKLK